MDTADKTTPTPGIPESAAQAAARAARVQHEASIRRNPHPDFKGVEAARPPWTDAAWRHTQTRDTSWAWGQGGSDGGASLATPHVEIDPHAPGRPATHNYKLMVSGVVPRPIGFVSTVGADGSANLAPFSYMNMACHDPPILTLGVTGGVAQAKDTLANLAESRECVINVVSEHYVEAANAASVAAPYGVSEWALTGLHPAPSTVVAPPRVQEAVFAVECRLLSLQQFDSRAQPGAKSGTLAVLEGVNFWVRQDAINEERNMVDIAVLRPVCRLGGITYGRVTEGFEIPRPDFAAVGPAANGTELLAMAAQPWRQQGA